MKKKKNNQTKTMAEMTLSSQSNQLY